MKLKLVCLHSAAVGMFFLSGLSPVSAHGYAVCYSGAYLNCVRGGGSPGNCSGQAEAMCRKHGHGGGGVQRPDLGFTSNGKPSFGKTGSKVLKFKRRARRR
jgi:hypothetical protein